jgi:signal transduction histidine kinase
MATRPLDRLTSIRIKLGSVIVFAVAVTILMMYLAVGFALRPLERDRQFRELGAEAKAFSALGFSVSGRPSGALLKAINNQPNVVVVVDATGNPLVGHFPVPLTVGRALAGYDQGVIGNKEYVGVPITRSGTVIGAIYLAHRVEGGGLFGAIEGTASFVRRVWWQLLLAGALAAFIALFLARLLARGMTQPLRDMAQAARRMARGDYRQRVHAPSRDEVGQLAEAFNRMAGEMEGLERLRRDLVANVSHELKTPISALRARLENLLDGVEDPDPVLIGVMLQQTERLSRLVDQLLDLSRLESGDLPLEIEPIDLGTLVERVVTEVEVARADRHIHVRNLVADDLPALEGDRERIHQVLFNLLDNAFRFTPSGGEVTVRAVRENGSCEVSVEDTGPGIPQEHLPLVFERFYRVDPSRSRDDGGTGIGLAIARSVVEAHGGRIWVESRVGEGSHFRFVLPTGSAGEHHAAPTSQHRAVGSTSEHNAGSTEDRHARPTGEQSTDADPETRELHGVPEHAEEEAV